MRYPTRHFATGSSAFSSYWDSENAPYLTGLLSQNIDVTAAEALVPYYNQVDERADAVAKEFFINNDFNQGIHAFYQQLKQYPQQRETASEAVQQLLDPLFLIPDWLDQDLLEAGGQLCNRSGTFGLATLRNYSLMGGYESAAINKPLIFTGALKKGAIKRLSDTIVFWINVTTSKGLALGNPGFVSTIMTRIIHAYSRQQIEANSNWDSHAWGRPLNQWDMQATNLGFSIVFIDGLKKLGFTPTKNEIEGVLHLWKYIGYLIGLPKELLLDTEQQAADALFLWTKTQKGADADSQSLADSLYQEPQQVQFTKSKLLKTFIQKTNLGYNNLLLGERSCDALHLKKTAAIHWVRWLSFMNLKQEKNRLRTVKKYDKAVAKGHREQLEVLSLYQKNNSK